MSDGVITVREVLTLSTRYLEKNGSRSARLDTEILTAMVLGVRRLDLYLAPERPLTGTERESLRGLVRRRGQGEPVAYITGRREFFGLTFRVNPSVLIPRPETEVLVDAVIEWLERRNPVRPRVADVGTGCGAIACSLAARNDGVDVVGTDLSAEALAVAQQNVMELDLEGRVRLVRCDLLQGFESGDALDAVVSNPPYVAEGESGLLDPDVRDYEPREALFAGTDGMSVTGRLVHQASRRLKSGGTLILEVGTPSQRDRTRSLLEKDDAFGEVQPLRDAARVVRGLQVERI